MAHLVCAPQMYKQVRHRTIFNNLLYYNNNIYVAHVGSAPQNMVRHKICLTCATKLFVLYIIDYLPYYRLFAVFENNAGNITEFIKEIIETVIYFDTELK